ncbi:PaaI family thioesterase [[Mycobacterium] zoologicum]|uniref:PaaI family thioesterase n=1 Tax=[Mycobacterium] zoologicum TaxID=2872311 RepID=UPI001CDB316F|nr:PaaI family thioesterase [Mycolicibacter sp. MYC101]MEB3063567.1 PaaI family thioesterase [Mycolicibacter sp. MYC101]
MDFGAQSGVPTIGADESEHLLARYGPLAEAVRELIDATIRTQADDATMREATTQVRQVTERLRDGILSDAPGMRYVVDGRPLAWGNAVIGLRNPIAPPLVIEHGGSASLDGGEATLGPPHEHGENGHCWSDFHLGAAYEGPPSLVHGGVSALILDHLLGEAASEGLTKPLFTGTITVKYLRGTPLGPLRAEAWVYRREAIKTYARGHIADSAGVTVEAEGVFIIPAWARESVE